MEEAVAIASPGSHSSLPIGAGRRPSQTQRVRYHDFENHVGPP